MGAVNTENRLSFGQTCDSRVWPIFVLVILHEHRMHAGFEIEILCFRGTKLAQLCVPYTILIV